MRLLFVATLLVSAAAISYEILLMRVLSIVQWHHFAYMIISLALLGYGASGTFIALTRHQLQTRFETVFAASALLFGVSMVACFILGQRIPFNALEIIWNPRQFLWLTAIYLVFFVPFFFAACCIGLAFTCKQSHIDRIYFFDLFGAGVGAALIVMLLFVLAPQQALLVLSTVALTASVSVGLTSARRVPLLAAQGLCLLALVAAVQQDWLGLRISPYKGLSQALQVVDARAVAARSGPLGLLTVVESPRIPIRHAPGLSFNTRFEPPRQLAVFTDGDGMSPISRYGGDLRSLGHLGDMTQALPYRLLDDPDVLVLGAGGGTDVLLALHNGAAHVDAVELNPQVTEFVESTFSEFAGALYADPRVAVHTAEARGFIAQGDGKYDLIHLALLDSFAASGSGVQALGESYLYTVEAIRDSLRRTTPDGMLAITRWLRLPPRDSLKLFATAIAALRASGRSDPGAHLALIRSWNTTTLLVARDAFTVSQIERIRDFTRSHSFDIVWYPGMRPDEANRYNLLDQPYIHDGAVALLGPDSDTYIARYKFDIDPATDDRPYFFQFFKWSALPEVLSLRLRGGAGLIEWGYLVLIATILQAAVAGAALILWPLASAPRTWPAGTVGRMGSYFFLLGLAFLFVEMAFIQKFILFLSHPLYAVAVVLAGFLVFAGFGSLLSGRVRRAAGGISPVTIAAGGIAALALMYVFLLPVLFESLIGLGDAARIAISIALIAPLAFLMGIPFPIGLAIVAERASDFVPWAWGINGFASVLSAALATLLAIEYGFSVVVVLAVLLYVVAALTIRG